MLITFPLVFGWLYFVPVEGNPEWYRVAIFGFETFSFPSDSVIAFFMFHGLVWSSFLVIGTFIWLPFGKFFCRRASLSVAHGMLWSGRRGGAPLAADGRKIPTPEYANPGLGEGPLGEEDAKNFIRNRSCISALPTESDS